MEVTLKLSVEEVNGILQTLGQLPTSSGAWPLRFGKNGRAAEVYDDIAQHRATALSVYLPKTHQTRHSFRSTTSLKLKSSSGV